VTTRQLHELADESLKRTDAVSAGKQEEHSDVSDAHSGTKSFIGERVREVTGESEWKQEE